MVGCPELLAFAVSMLMHSVLLITATGKVIEEVEEGSYDTAILYAITAAVLAADIYFWVKFIAS